MNISINLSYSIVDNRVMLTIGLGIPTHQDLILTHFRDREVKVFGENLYSQWGELDVNDSMRWRYRTYELGMSVSIPSSVYDDVVTELRQLENVTKHYQVLINSLPKNRFVTMAVNANGTINLWELFRPANPCDEFGLWDNES